MNSKIYLQISETYAFLPREAVTHFLSICPECKKNLRSISPTSLTAREENLHESSSEFNVIHHSTNIENSLDAPISKTSNLLDSFINYTLKPRRHSNPDNYSKLSTGFPLSSSSLMTESKSQTLSPFLLQTNRNNANNNSIHSLITKTGLSVMRRASAPPITSSNPHSQSINFHAHKSKDSLTQYYDFMRRLYAGNVVPSETVPPELAIKEVGKKGICSVQSENSNRLRKVTKTKLTLDQNISCSDNEDEENITQIQPKRFKNSGPGRELSSVGAAVDAGTTSGLTLQVPIHNKELLIETALSNIPLSSTEGINLSQSSLSTYRNNPELLKIPSIHSLTTAFTPSPMVTASTPISLKKEAVSVLNRRQSFSKTPLRIPNVTIRSGVPRLPALIDIGHLKPITNTYLQLTRSMGLTDEEALCFGTLVSDDFDYKVLAKN